LSGIVDIAIVEVELLRKHPLLGSSVEITDEGSSRDLDIVSLVVLAEEIDSLQQLCTHPVNSREGWNNRLEDTDGVANVHVLASLQTCLKCVVDQSVPLVKKASEVLIVEEDNRDSFRVKLLGKPRQISLGSECLLLVDSLVGMPLAQVTQNLAEKLSQVICFLRGAKEDEGDESVFTEELIQQAHSPEIGGSRVVEELEHLEGEESVKWGEEEPRNETLLQKSNV
jgi:hypothetical protein